MQPRNSARILACAVGGVHPVVVGAGILVRAGADVGEVLDPRDIARVRTVQVAARELFRFRLLQLPAGEQLRR